MKNKTDNRTGMIDKVYGCFQIAVAAVVLLFALFNFIRTIVQHGAGLYIAAFAIMIVAAYCFLEVSIEEYKEGKKI